MVFWPGPWPWTSADGLSTLRSSARSEKVLPSSKSISRTFFEDFLLALEADFLGPVLEFE